MPEQNHREPGFYWVQLGANLQEIANWQGDEWWLCGNEKPWPPDIVEVLSARLVMRPKLTVVTT